MTQLYPNDSRAKTFTLPVSGSVRLLGAEVGLIDTPQFQRLCGIKQLGTSYVAFRGATHTRFEHSLGALHEAERMVQAINANPRSDFTVPPEAHRLARLGALLHDVAHVPFGHTLEDEFRLLPRHDENSARFSAIFEATPLREQLDVGLGSDAAGELLAVLKAKKDPEFAALRYPYVGDIVGNTVCADLLDYVKRDLTACGLPVALGERFLDFLTISAPNEVQAEDCGRIVLNLDKRNMPRPDTESEVIKLLNYRYELAERVYFHHAKNAASVMIARAVQEAGFAVGADTPTSHDLQFLKLSDEMLLVALGEPSIAAIWGIEPVPEHEGDRKLAARLAVDVSHRRLFKVAYLGVYDDLASRVGTVCAQYSDPSARREYEDRIAARVGLPAGAVLLHLPRQKMMTKAAEVRVRTERGDILSLSDWDSHHSRRVDALNDAHKRLWRITVFIDPDHIERAGDVRAVLEADLKAASRYVERRAPQLLRHLFDRYAGERGWTLDDIPALEAMGSEEAAQSLDDLLNAIQVRIDQYRRSRERPA